MKDFKLSLSNLGYFVAEITKMLKSNKPYRVNIKEWKGKRSLDANAQIHVWYKQIADFKQCDIKSAGARCKIDFGIPIILGDENHGPVLNYILEKTNFWRMSYEQQEKMIQGIAITRIMSTKQHNQYRDQMQMYWYNNGLELVYKND